ncbi:o-succinylbenzoate synthase [Bombilactobacillus thymidiniphilus]|uniref:o-succinylbenzoate synthase n=1 Tax=Bombilactobacillus thymidiniphilus TaxID=2923363 RepID=A0ABY4PEX0_9LACO|nr:o-succinylbenzoate synthase [Bombilactobacillus thymidiniphilus]UQS84137.1 o-succinylbenzoate synthase [Bombilactobacillus thymidiniphilus]
MKLVALKLLPITLQLKRPFVSAHEVVQKRSLTLVAVQNEQGLWGYGELDAFATPFYTADTQAIAQDILENYLWPLVKEQSFQHPSELYALLAAVRDHQPAKSALDMAIWDLYAKEQQQPLAQALAQSVASSWRKEVAVGISIGLQEPSAMLSAVQAAQKAGYQRIKLKVNGNQDLRRIQQLQLQKLQTLVTVDANGSMQADTNLAAQIDALALGFIEDPFSVQEGIASQNLQQQLQTKICFDEPIDSVNHAVMAVQLQQCRVISLKLATIGGLTPALQLVQAHRQYHFPLWCGGMLEGGIGRAANLALASLTEFSYPADLSATDHYYYADYTSALHLKNGQLQVPQGDGIGMQINPEYLKLLAQQPKVD